MSIPHVRPISASMKWIFLGFLLFFVFSTDGYRQKWQILSDYQQKMLFGDAPADKKAFYEANNLTDIFELCNSTAEGVETTANYSSAIASNECITFFEHRKEAQRWIDQLFKVLPQYNISTANAAKLKSWFWMMDAKTNSMAETIYCFKKAKFRNAIPEVVWTKLDSVFDEILKENGPIGQSAYDIFADETARRKRLESYGFDVKKHYCD